MTSFRYSGDLLGGSLQVRESRVIADLLLRQTDNESWRQAIQQDNLLQKRSPATALRLANALRKRLEPLEAPFWQALRDGDDELATQVAFCAAMERNLLLVEFMETVVKDALVTHVEILEPYLWQEFLDERAHRDSTLHTWTESSRKKMGQVVYRMLAEVGLLHSTRDMRLQPLIPRPEVRALLDDSSRQRLKACLEITC